MCCCWLTNPGCHERSGRDKDVSFFRIPKVVTGRGGKYRELSEKRRAGFLSAISRDDLTEKILTHDRICSRHFILGRPAALEDELNPDWLPTLNLGHSKVTAEKVVAAEERWERKKARDDFIARNEAARSLVLLGVVTRNEAARSLVLLGVVDSSSQQEIKEGLGTQTDLTSDMIAKLQAELAKSYSTIHSLKNKLEQTTPFREASLQSDEVVRFYTGLPNLKILYGLSLILWHHLQQIAPLQNLPLFKNLWS